MSHVVWDIGIYYSGVLDKVSMKNRTYLAFLGLAVLSAGAAFLLVRSQSTIVDLIKENRIALVLSAILSIALIALVLRYRPLKPYPLFRFCLALWPGLGGLMASGILLVRTYAPASYGDALFNAALIMVALFFIQLMLLPFALYQISKRSR